MIDGPQQALRPEAAVFADEFAHEEISEGVWERLVRAATEMPSDPWLIVVDNVPRAVGQPYKIVDYTGEPGQAPYGLIENEEGRT